MPAMVIVKSVDLFIFILFFKAKEDTILMHIRNFDSKIVILKILLFARLL